MNMRTLRTLLKYILTLLFLLALAQHVSAQQPNANPTPGISIGGGKTIPRVRPDAGPKPKTIHGTVQDSDGRLLEGAHVLVRDTKSSVTRTLTTNAEGVYSGSAFPSASNYDVTAEYRGQASDKKTVSAYLDREDNVLNFQLKVSGSTATPAAAAAKPTGLQIDTFDLVKLHAVMDIPAGVPAPISAVLLLHGYGEDLTVWNDFKKELLAKGFAVLAVDLRGHGESKTKNTQTIAASKDWRNSPHEFPLDVDAAMTWLKTQTRINSNKIAIIGVDVGANLALIASGKYREVRTVIAVNPNLREGQEMAGSAQDYKPHSALILSSNDTEGNSVKNAVLAPTQVRVITQAGGTASWFQNKQVSDSVLQWLKDTF